MPVTFWIGRYWIPNCVMMTSDNLCLTKNPKANEGRWVESQLGYGPRNDSGLVQVKQTLTASQCAKILTNCIDRFRSFDRIPTITSGDVLCSMVLSDLQVSWLRHPNLSKAQFYFLSLPEASTPLRGTINTSAKRHGAIVLEPLVLSMFQPRAS